MAKFSQQFLKSMSSPGLFEMGVANLGDKLGDMRLRQRQTRESENIQQILQANINNPAKLQQLAQEYQIKGNAAAAAAFQDAAKRVTAKYAAGQQRGVQGGLTAITQAAARGVPLEQLQEGVRSVVAQGGTQADIMQAYKAGTDLAKGEKPEIIQGTPGTQFFTQDENGKMVLQQTVPFKPESTASKGIKIEERKDGSLTIVDADDGSLISTLPPPEAGKGDREASLNLIAQTTSFIQDIDKLMDPSFMETGFVGGVTAAVPGTPAYDREKELLSIRARLGFDQINEMKRLAAESGASGTGLGQISNIEFMSLQSTIDAIYTGMSGENQNEALANIKKHLLNVQKLASGVAPADAIEWDRPEYKAVGYHKDPDTGTVFYAPDGPSGTVYKLVNGEFVKIGA
jgi:hypothetical protein